MLAVIAPRDIALYPVPPGGSPRNTWSTRVAEVHLLGDRARVLLDAPVPVTAEITAVALAELGLTDGLAGVGVGQGHPDRRLRCRTSGESRVHAGGTGSAIVGPMRLSVRNQLRGTVTDVRHGSSISTVKVELEGGDVVTSAITREAAEDLGLAAGSTVTILVKATDVWR